MIDVCMYGGGDLSTCYKRGPSSAYEPRTVDYNRVLSVRAARHISICPALETDRVGLLEAPTRAMLVPGLCIHVDLESALQLTELVLGPQ